MSTTSWDSNSDTRAGLVQLSGARRPDAARTALVPVRLSTRFLDSDPEHLNAITLDGAADPARGCRGVGGRAFWTAFLQRTRQRRSRPAFHPAMIPSVVAVGGWVRRLDLSRGPSQRARIRLGRTIRRRLAHRLLTARRCLAWISASVKRGRRGVKVIRDGDRGKITGIRRRAPGHVRPAGRRRPGSPADSLHNVSQILLPSLTHGRTGSIPTPAHRS